MFGEIFQPLIAEYHKIDGDQLKSVHDLDVNGFCEEMPESMSSEILSTRIRVGRSVKGFPMAGKLTKQVSLKFLRK